MLLNLLKIKMYLCAFIIRLLIVVSGESCLYILHWFFHTHKLSHRSGVTRFIVVLAWLEKDVDTLHGDSCKRNKIKYSRCSIGGFSWAFVFGCIIKIYYCIKLLASYTVHGVSWHGLHNNDIHFPSEQADDTLNFFYFSFIFI